LGQTWQALTALAGRHGTGKGQCALRDAGAWARRDGVQEDHLDEEQESRQARTVPGVGAVRVQGCRRCARSRYEFELNGSTHAGARRGGPAGSRRVPAARCSRLTVLRGAALLKGHMGSEALPRRVRMAAPWSCAGCSRPCRRGAPYGMTAGGTRRRAGPRAAGGRGLSEAGPGLQTDTWQLTGFAAPVPGPLAHNPALLAQAQQRLGALPAICNVPCRASRPDAS
jgi:hypothetical protein